MLPVIAILCPHFRPWPAPTCESLCMLPVSPATFSDSHASSTEKLSVQLASCDSGPPGEQHRSQSLCQRQPPSLQGAASALSTPNAPFCAAQAPLPSDWWWVYTSVLASQLPDLFILVVHSPRKLLWKLSPGSTFAIIVDGTLRLTLVSLVKISVQLWS